MLGQCYDDNPKFALRASKTKSGITNILINDETGLTKIIPYQNGGRIYNDTSYASLDKYVFHKAGPKRIILYDESVNILFPNILLFMHWTQQQVLLLFPTYLTEFSCGMCTVNSLNTVNFYKEL